MSLITKTQEAIHQLGQMPDPKAICVQMAGQTLTCQLDTIDQLALAFSDFDLFDDRLANASMERLSEVSQKLSAALTYLLEPIAPIEIDADRCVVQMRSSPPSRDEDSRSYYELLIQCDGHLRLNRYTKPNGGLRQLVPSHVTREVFVRLVGDFASAAQQPATSV
jgi:hypothetical protein